MKELKAVKDSMKELERVVKTLGFVLRELYSLRKRTGNGKH